MSRIVPARAFQGAPFSLTGAGGWTKIPLDTLAWDMGGNFDLPNSRYICPVGAFYHVIGQIELLATGGNETIGVAIFRNSVADTEAGGPGPVQNALGAVIVTDLIRCGVGDVLELYGFTDATSQPLRVGGTRGNFLTIASAE
jgi:hypothetical protein